MNDEVRFEQTHVQQTKSKVDTPLTGNSSNKTKPRFTVNLDKSEAMDLSGNVTPVKSSREHEVPTEMTDVSVFLLIILNFII